MKTKIKLIVFTLLFSGFTNAQIPVQVSIGQQPDWGPIGYQNVNYYYLPEIETYYDIHSAQFIYLNRGTWMRSKYLPQLYRGYDLYHGYKVVLNVPRNSNPYKNFNFHRVKYKNVKNNKFQKSIRDQKISPSQKSQSGIKSSKKNKGNKS